MTIKEKTKENPSITPDVFAHLVKLAALEMDEAQAEYLRKELNKQLSVIHELEAISLDEETPITSHGVPYTPDIKPALRGDKVFSCPNPGDIVAQAPETQDGYIVIADIPQKTLE